MSANGGGRRLLGLVVVALLAVALVLWGAAQGDWLVATWSDPLRGTVVTSASGADTEPVLVAWALLALAAIAGVLATALWGRRVIGALLVLAGVLAGVRALAGLVAPTEPGALPAAARGPGALVAVEVSTLWPLLAASGAVGMTATGAAIALRATTLPRLGARYERPSSSTDDGPATAGSAADRGAPSDPDKELWDALDQGRDPTVDQPADAPTPVRPDVEGPSTMGAGTADGVGRS